MSLADWRAFVESVRSASDLQSLIEEDTKFEGQFACCPFHKEKTPSFHLRDPEHFHCFGCGIDGDVFEYFVARDRISFREAVEKVGRKYGISWEHGESALDDPDVRAELAKSWDRIQVQEIHDRAAGFCHFLMPSRVRNWAKKKWHFTDEVLKERKIGWCNEQVYHYLHDDLEYTDEQLLKSGLFVKTKEGIKPFFDHRVIIPYFKGGHVKYFIGRQTPWTDTDLPHEKGKYKKLLTHNDRHKYVSRVVENHWFYNEDDARGSIERLVITEGITDAISLSMVGQRNISPVTTRFSNNELERAAELCRNIPRVIICNDADVLDDGRQPGLEGALSTAAYLYDKGIQAFIAELPRPADVQKLDLNEFIGKAFEEGGEQHAKKKLDEVLKKAKPYVEFSIDSIPKDTSTTELNEKLADVFDLVAKREPIERARYAQQISRRFKIQKATITRQIESRVREDEREAADEEREQAQERKRKRNREDERIRGRVFEDIGCYYTLARDNTMEIISSFSIVPKRIIRYEDKQFLIDATLRTESGAEYEHVFSYRAWISKRDFLRDLRHPALQWTGNDDNVQGVLRLLKIEELKQHEGTANLGFYMSENGPRWVTRDVVFGPDGPVEEDITYVDTHAPMADRLRYEFLSADEERALAKKVLPALMQINKAEVILPCLGWFISTIVKPLIEEQIGHFPVLLVSGTQGSGKTSLLRDIMWPLLGVVRPRDPFSVTDTHFATIRNLACSNSLPVMFDEYKPGDMSQQHIDRIHRAIRRVYGGEMEVRGRSDQGMEKYRLGAAMVIAGESRPEGDPAILERILSVTPEKTALTPARQEAFNTVARSDHWRLAARIIQHVLGLDFTTFWERSKKITDELLLRIDQSGAIPLRCYDNLRVMVLGILYVEDYAKSVGIELPDMDYVAGFRHVVKAVLEGDEGSVKDGFDRFLEVISTLAHLGLIEAGKHFVVEDDEVHIHLAACHQVYLTERRKAGQPDETNGIRALRQIAREKVIAKSYVKKADERHPIGDGQPRCVRIDQSKVPSTLDYTELRPKKGTRRYTDDDVQDDWTNN